MPRLILKEGRFKKGKFVSNKKPGDIFYKNGFQHTKRRLKKNFLKNGITYRKIEEQCIPYFNGKW